MKLVVKKIDDKKVEATFERIGFVVRLDLTNVRTPDDVWCEIVRRWGELGEEIKKFLKSKDPQVEYIGF